MKRVKDYASFAVWFIGASYIVLWPLLARGHGVAVSRALSLCDVRVGSASECSLSAPPALPFALHGIGMAAVIFVLVQLILAVAKRIHRKAASACRDPFSIAAWRIRMRIRPIAHNTPRREFGLRGTDRRSQA